MRLNYNKVKTFFNENFSSYEENGRRYYFDKEGKIIATANNKIITTFYEEEQTNIKYAVSVIRKMYVGKENDKKVIDAMYIQPINELYKETSLENNFAIKINKYEQQGMQKAIRPIGTIAKGKNGKRILKNEDFTIEIEKREFVKRDFFNQDGVYLLELQKQYKTKKLNYDNVYNYYQNENKWLESDKVIPGKEIARQFIKKRNIQSYDELIRPVIKRNK